MSTVWKRRKGRRPRSAGRKLKRKSAGEKAPGWGSALRPGWKPAEMRVDGRKEAMKMARRRMKDVMVDQRRWLVRRGQGR